MLNICKLKGILAKIRDWMKGYHFPPKLTFCLLGIISIVWLLIRVIPNPACAGYPCMRVAAPFMSGFVMYLVSLGCITFALRKVKKNIVRARYFAAGSFVLVAMVGMVFSIVQGSQDANTLAAVSTGLDDGPNWPEDITYDPDGIELVSIPSKITGSRAAPQMRKSEAVSNGMVANFDIEKSKFTSVENFSFEGGASLKKFYSGFIDDNGDKWFLTDSGIAFGESSFFDRIFEMPVENLKQFSFQLSSDGSKVWFATPKGAFCTNMPFDPDSAVVVYNTENSSILSDSVISIIVGGNDSQWIATDKGVSGLQNNKWLTLSYENDYPEGFFEIFPITTMATNQGGDSLFVGTMGAGVGRFTRNDVDGISGASPYAQWGPCRLPSDNIYSICVNGDTQWYGTDAGLARHDGYDYFEGWTAYTTEDGLVDNFVQTIEVDPSGRLWLGTKGGISVLEDSEWINYTINDGLLSNNILSIVSNRFGEVYIGTDNGFMVINKNTLVCFQ